MIIRNSNKKKEETTSALAGFHAGPTSWWNWSLEMLGFVEGGKRENPEKNPQSKVRTNNKLNPHNLNKELECKLSPTCFLHPTG